MAVHDQNSMRIVTNYTVMFSISTLFMCILEQGVGSIKWNRYITHMGVLYYSVLHKNKRIGKLSFKVNTIAMNESKCPITFILKYSIVVGYSLFANIHCMLVSIT